MMPPKSVWKLARYYPMAEQAPTLLRPTDYGLNRIGHIEVFSPKNAAIWPDIIT